MKTDIQIARECQLAPIGEIASQLGIDPEKIEQPTDTGDGYQSDEGGYR